MSSVQSFIISCAKIKVSFLIKEINQLQIQIWMASTGTLKLHTVDSRVNKHIYARSVHFLISICVIDVLTGIYYAHIHIYILHIFLEGFSRKLRINGQWPISLFTSGRVIRCQEYSSCQPRTEYSKLCWNFLRHGGRITSEITGKRRWSSIEGEMTHCSLCLQVQS